MLFVGPHKPYLAYVADVLPSLGEEGVQTCTLRDLVPQGATAAEETDPAVTRLKSSADLVRAIDTDRGDGAGRAGHPRRAPGRERAASIRSSGHPVVRGSARDLRAILDAWLAAHADGTACVIGDPTFQAMPRVQSLTPESAKGLEFDLVVLVEPETFGDGIEGAVDRYVAMTRATPRLVILRSGLRVGGGRSAASPARSSADR